MQVLIDLVQNPSIFMQSESGPSNEDPVAVRYLTFPQELDMI